ncbi:hypothetical protein AVEN_97891-1 [Araneus ventricosus]|uniref:Uncharacterized protein n=1 Tax=Araneus ventricosus TaxID=182803 RepID=A0A4Y2BUD3_ARAVE|nr:hypothetical protein AVEN_97891-1 [Araneus ventricosus]
MTVRAIRCLSLNDEKNRVVVKELICTTLQKDTSESKVTYLLSKSRYSRIQRQLSKALVHITSPHNRHSCRRSTPTYRNGVVEISNKFVEKRQDGSLNLGSGSEMTTSQVHLPKR